MEPSFKDELDKKLIDKLKQCNNQAILVFMSKDYFIGKIGPDKLNKIISDTVETFNNNSEEGFEFSSEKILLIDLSSSSTSRRDIEIMFGIDYDPSIVLFKDDVVLGIEKIEVI